MNDIDLKGNPFNSLRACCQNLILPVAVCIAEADGDAVTDRRTPEGKFPKQLPVTLKDSDAWDCALP